MAVDFSWDAQKSGSRNMARIVGNYIRNIIKTPISLNHYYSS
jgi:hypothetical protein